MNRRSTKPRVTASMNQMPAQTVLPSGITVVSDYVSHVRTVAIGIWIGCGSQHDHISGTAHMLEHVLFRRSARYTGTERSRITEMLGAYVNASTSKEVTSYYVRGLAEHTERLIDILAELVFAPAFTEHDVEKERDVIIEELHAYEDDPEEVIGDQLDTLLFGNHPLAHPIAGTIEQVRSITLADLEAFYRRWYTAGNCAVIISGPLEHTQAVELVDRILNRWAPRSTSMTNSVQRPPRQRTRGQRMTISRPFQQAHCGFGIQTPGARSSDRHAYALLNILLGDSASSRLYRQLRERRGLAYSVYSSLQLLRDCGELVVYAGIRSDRTEVALAAIEAELARLRTNPPTMTEFRRAQQQLRSSILMSTESLSARMNAIARMLFEEGTLEPIDAIAAAIEQTTLEDVQRIAEELSNVQKWSVVLCREGTTAPAV
jgi:predicted Zn-dependent peptidase